ncbi:hypothetical protein SAMN05444370_12215 [Rubrimonas cliftonensis]|uniref:Uncharacterized protein n=1 Tax=Rubrimonas cliftonensis TaxID=89524 RepID=A0A1H4FGF9_9RHOB|nr:hypothetical protein SAMN05444370_12215 [Rubrimonas cliftonensis]
MSDAIALCSPESLALLRADAAARARALTVNARIAVADGALARLAARHADASGRQAARRLVAAFLAETPWSPATGRDLAAVIRALAVAASRSPMAAAQLDAPLARLHELAAQARALTAAQAAVAALAPADMAALRLGVKRR